jgi:Farnesoic acid 0-methyl transferase
MHSLFDMFSSISFAAHQLTITTPAVQTWNTAWFTVQKTQIAFEVRACSAVRVLLLDQNRIDLAQYMREVILGASGNTKNVILGRNNATLVENNTANVVQCNDFRQFLISWDSGTLLVSRPQLSGDVLLKYLDAEMRPIHSIAISTGDGSTGEWRFGRDAGKTILLFLGFF